MKLRFSEAHRWGARPRRCPLCGGDMRASILNAPPVNRVEHGPALDRLGDYPQMLWLCAATGCAFGEIYVLA